MNINLKIWRQRSPQIKGELVDYQLADISEDISFLEMLDILNQKLILEGMEPIVFDHDCREGVCGACSLMINGEAHGPLALTTTCQLYMRNFCDGDTIIVEPFRANPFKLIRDLKVDRGAFDEIIASGGYISAQTGQAPESNSFPISPQYAELAMDAASCIGCGACVAACYNASAMLFVAAKISHLANLPQGQIEAKERVLNMVKTMDKLKFGYCSNEGECEASCPKGISMITRGKLNREFFKATFA